MKIDQHNYETYLMDFIEGRLDSFTIAELQGFLTTHPELKKELEDYEEITITPENIKFPNKRQLKKFTFDNVLIDNRNFEDFCIAFYENLLSPAKIHELFSYMEQYPNLKKDFGTYKYINLTTKPIEFDQKQTLYKKSNSKERTIIRWASVAAGILILFGIYFLIINHYKPTDKLILNRVIIEADNAKSKNSLTQKNSIERSSGVDTKHNKNQNCNCLNTFNSIDTLNKLQSNPILKEDESIAYIPYIQLTYIENNMDLDSELNLSYDTYNLEFNQFKKQNIWKNVTHKLSNNINQLKNSRGRISFFRLAQLGITGINQLTNTRMQLVEKTDTAGNVIALSFQSGLFEYHKIKGD